MAWNRGSRPLQLREEIFKIPARISDIDDRACEGGFYTEVKNLVTEARTHHLETVNAYIAGDIAEARASLAATEECVERALLLLGSPQRRAPHMHAPE